MTKELKTKTTETHTIDGKEIIITATVHSDPETFTVVECQDTQGRFRGFFIPGDKPSQAIQEMIEALENK